MASMFKFSDAVLRNLIIRRDEAITEASLLAEAGDSDDDDVEDRSPVTASNDDDAESKADDTDEDSKEKQA